METGFHEKQTLLFKIRTDLRVCQLPYGAIVCSLTGLRGKLTGLPLVVQLKRIALRGNELPYGVIFLFQPAIENALRGICVALLLINERCLFLFC